jgi:hypothetical protein
MAPKIHYYSHLFLGYSSYRMVYPTHYCYYFVLQAIEQFIFLHESPNPDQEQPITAQAASSNPKYPVI